MSKWKYISSSILFFFIFAMLGYANPNCIKSPSGEMRCPSGTYNLPTDSNCIVGGSGHARCMDGSSYQLNNDGSYTDYNNNDSNY